jgi:hypothetical protein
MRAKRALTAFVVPLLLSACLSFPQPPGTDVAVRVAHPVISLTEGLELYTINQQDQSGSPKAQAQHPSVPVPRRNLLFAALDQKFQAVFDDDLKALYKTTEQVRMEDLAWWLIAPQTKKIYNQVIRVSYRHFTKDTLLAALDAMEKLGEPYDVFLMTHGFPNNIVTIDKSHPVTWEDVGNWKGRFPRLELMFMQSCYGNSLAPDWLAAGAKAVLGYKGMDRNFFYPLTFLNSMRKHFTRFGMPMRNLGPQERIQNLKAAYEEAGVQVRKDVHRNELAGFMVRSLGLTLEEYLSQASNPELLTP